jgi:hypothetical protein
MSNDAKPREHASTRTTGGDSIEGVDPGGTRSTKPGQADKSAPKARAQKADQIVTTGNRNDMNGSRQAGPDQKPQQKGG